MELELMTSTPSEQSIINALQGELNRANDNRVYLMALVGDLQQENARLAAQLTEFTQDAVEESTE